MKIEINSKRWMIEAENEEEEKILKDLYNTLGVSQKIREYLLLNPPVAPNYKVTPHPDDKYEPMR